MVPDLETGDMIGLMSLTGPGLVTEINDPRQLLLLEDQFSVTQAQIPQDPNPGDLADTKIQWWWRNTYHRLDHHPLF